MNKGYQSSNGSKKKTAAMNQHKLPMYDIIYNDNTFEVKIPGSFNLASFYRMNCHYIDTASCIIKAEVNNDQ